jgi:hypothetical protein
LLIARYRSRNIFREALMDNADSTAPPRGWKPERVAAIVLIAAPLLEILAMAHHPTVHPQDAVQLVTRIKELAPLAALVHGFLIALLVATLLALSEFSIWRGLRRAPVRAALMAYGTGVVLMICAALVSGLVAPRIAGAGADLVPTDAVLVTKLVAVAMLFNQAFARCGAILMSLGICAWSMDLLRDRHILLGGFGTVCGIGGGLAVLSGLLRLDVHGAMAVTVLDAVWTVGVGWHVLRYPSNARSNAH